MKKYIIGVIFGFALATTVGANAQEVNKLVDAVVQGVFTVSVDGVAVGDAIVVNDTTYLPVREFGEATGYNVAFNQDNGEVVLTKNVEPTEPAPTEPVKTEKDSKIEALNKKISDLNGVIANNKNVLKSNEELAKRFIVNADDLKKMADTINASITQAESLIAGFQSQITELETQQ